MWRASAPYGGGTGSSLVLLLLCSLVLSGILAYQAQDAARSHRAASESALRDYAELASNELGRQLEDEMEDLADGIVDARNDADRLRNPDARLEEFVEDISDELGACACPQLLHDYFLLDLRSGLIEFSGSASTPEVRTWIGDTVRVHAATEEARRLREGGGSGSGRGFADGLWRIDLPGPPARSVLYSVARDDEGQHLRAYGLVIDRGAYAAATTRAIVLEEALLPPSLSRGTPDDAMLSVAVMSGGERLFHSGGPAEAATEVVDTLRTALGIYPLHVAVRPDMAGRLVIGGLPRSRFPLLLGIFLLTLGLSTIAIIQLRRQQALVRLRSGFVASVSHELRTPLAQIRLFSDLLASGRLGEEQRARSVRIIGEEAQRLAYLVENVLRFSRSEQRLDRVTKEPTDLAALAREIVDGFTPLANACAARIDCSVEAGAMAELDQDAVRQVLLNLLDNAVKYGPHGQTVRVGVARDGAFVRLSVEDEGPGIPLAERASIWEPYHRLERDVEAATGGSGIGLAVVRDLVAMHGGTVAIEEAAGGGARFLAWFPAEARRPGLGAAERPLGSEVPA
jgi:signal transduction histidine kinase